jgi:hypothetical protein
VSNSPFLNKLAERAGYSNIDKGMRRMQHLEDDGNFFPKEPIRKRFAKALDISEKELQGTIESDFRGLDQPVEPRIIVRYMATVYKQH